jgi:cytochrome P450
MSQCPHFDLLNPATYADGVPFDQLQQLRNACPVSKQRDTDNDMDYWAITRREDIDFVSKNPKLFSSRERLALLEEMDDQMIELQRTQIIHMDPPDHIKHRRIVRNAFTVKAVDALEPFMREKIKEVVNRVADKGECEFVAEISAEIPLLVICELMGIPSEERAVFRHHVDVMLGGLDPTMNISEEEQTASMMAIFEQGNKLAQQHAENPQDNLIAKLLDGTVDGESLSDMEFVTFFLLLIVGGIETTRTSTSHGMRLLMEHPEQYQMLVDNPDLVPDAVEEILRFNPAFIHMRRTAMEDVELGGMQIKKGDKVVLMYDSANHDESVFGDDSEVFDVTRAQRQPDLRSDHRTFGIGQHFCLGSHLARKEMYIVFEEIVKRIRNPQFVGKPHFAQSNFISGIHSMNIHFDMAS